MPRKAPTDETPEPEARRRVTVPLTMPAELEDRVIEAAGKVGLSKQDTMRLSLDRGLDILVKQLTTMEPAPRT